MSIIRTDLHQCIVRKYDHFITLNTFINYFLEDRTREKVNNLSVFGIYNWTKLSNKCSKLNISVLKMMAIVVMGICF